MNKLDRPQVVTPRRRKPGEPKPSPPAATVAAADKAKARLQRRPAINPGVAVEVLKLHPLAYKVGSPHNDQEAWEAMICDALGTRSLATAETFLHELSRLCALVWQEGEGDKPGEWCPDERQLNMILNFIAGTRPRNELQAALAAQMVAVHLMQMRTAQATLAGSTMCIIDDRMAAISGKLARTFAIQTDTLAKLKGGRTSRQKITVKYEKHEHIHQHVHVDRGGGENGGQPYRPERGDNGRTDWIEGAPEPSQCASLPCPDALGEVLRFPGNEGAAKVPNPRGRQRVGGAKG